MLRAHYRTAIGLALLASLIAAVRIGSTWRVFNETADEAPDYGGLFARARAGNLLFYFLGCLSVWLLARRCGGTVVAAVSVGLFTLIPIVLGHAGVATTDMALSACIALAFWGWQ
jgi:hypothetical protein